MVDSPAAPSNAAKPVQNPAVPGEQSGKVVTLPDSMEVVARARRVEGEILRQNPDGSTRIKTSEGSIDVQLRGRVPETGTRVQVDIPSGNPPRQVTVRPAPPQPPPPPGQTAQPATPPPAQNAPPPTTTPQPLPPPAQARPLPSAPNIPLPPTGQGTTASPPVTTPLPEGAVVRLLPATPAQIQQAVQQAIGQIALLPTAATQTAFSASLIAKSAPDNLITQLLNLVRAAPPNTAGAPLTPTLTTPPPVAAAGSPALTLAGQPTALQPVLTPPALNTPAIPLPASAGGHIPFQPASAFLTPAITTAGGPSVMPSMPMLDGTVIKITPPMVQGSPSVSPGPIAMPQATPQTLTATVIGMMPQGQPLVSMPTTGGGIQQHAILQFPASNLPIGTQIQIVPTMPLQTASAPGLPPVQALPLLHGVRWPVLSETFQFLQTTEPALASAMAKTLPSPASPRAMPAAALLFIAAAKAGDLTAWLGDKKIDALQKLGGKSLLGRLSTDGQQTARLAADPLPGTDWRALPLPMFWQNEIEKITLYFKKNEENQQNQGDGEQTRFIFDLSLSRIGEMQIDGLMRGQRLDLIVRSQSPFSQGMQAHMKQLYHAAIEEVSLTGDLSFQGDPRAWVHVLQKEEQYQANI
jgi:hypothetical protein